MRSIYAFCVLVILFLFPLSVIAEESAGTGDNPPETGAALNSNVFTVAFDSGFLWGRGIEIVYHGNPPRNSAPYISRLDWDLKPLVFMGLRLEYAPQQSAAQNGLYASLGLRLGLPLKTGVMEDRDWLAYGEDFLTNYSNHDAYSRSTFDDIASGYGTLSADLSAGYSWAFLDRVWIRPAAELSWLRFSWESHGGYIQYGKNNPGGSNFVPWDPAFPKETISGAAINYSQNWFVFSPAVAFGINLPGSFSLSLSAALSPLVYGICRDDHLKRDFTVIDILFGGLYLHQGAELKFAPTENLSVSVSAFFTNLEGSRGDTYQSTAGGPFVLYKNVAGGGFSFAEFSLALSLRF